MEVYILFSLGLENCGREDKVFDLELLSVHSTLEKAHSKTTSLKGKEYPLIETSMVGLEATNELELGDGWMIKCPTYPNYPDKIFYFIAKQILE
tara:strand:- start:3380 stop:3661 length:282 start_codon:yes stop_codon:yes gene_type:complete